jgi:hypothetical protein
VRVKFQAEAFDLLSRADRDVPGFLSDSGAAGRVTAAQGDARPLRYALRVLF